MCQSHLEQLAVAVFAEQGTMAEEVQKMMFEMNYTRPPRRRGYRQERCFEPLGLESAVFPTGDLPKIGLVLRSVPDSRTYSIKPEFSLTGAIIFSIGGHLPRRRLREVAGSLLAFLKTHKRQEVAV